MKKNRMMRFASLVLVLTLLSTCAISGTFAKYTTTTSGADSARVAKWGVQMGVSDDTTLFKTTYAKDDASVTLTGTANTTNSVNAENSKDVVAPGTKGSFEFFITGTPEVAVNVAITLDGDGDADTTDDNLSMITLPAATYVDYTKAPVGSFTLSNNYYPVVWTLKRSDTKPTDWGSVTAATTGNLQAIQDYFADGSTAVSGNFAPNTKLDTKFGYYQLSWSWAFEKNDSADTYLGNCAAGIPTDIVKPGVVLNEVFSLKIAVTQID